MSNICIFLLIVLPSICGQETGLRPVTFGQYKDKKNWIEAQAFCRKSHTDLVTIRSEKDSQVIFTGHGWMGLYQEDDNSSWKWSREDEEATFFSWNPEEPHIQEQEHCVLKSAGSDGWMNAGCHVEAPFMCYDEKLVLVKDNKTWEEALEHCRSLGEVESEGSYYDLATLTTQDDHEYAQERAQHATTEEVWTGLRYLGDEWVWVGGEQVQYQDIPSCPAVRCGVLEKGSNTSFGMRACSQRRNFFCYRRS